MSFFSKIGSAVKNVASKVNSAIGGNIAKTVNKTVSYVAPKVSSAVQSLSSGAAKSSPIYSSSSKSTQQAFPGVNTVLNKITPSAPKSSGSSSSSSKPTLLMNNPYFSNPSRSSASGGTGGGSVVPKANYIPGLSGDIPVISYSAGLIQTPNAYTQALSGGSDNGSSGNGQYSIQGGQSLIPGSLSPTSRSAGLLMNNPAFAGQTGQEKQAKEWQNYSKTGSVPGGGIFGNTRIGTAFSTIGKGISGLIGGAGQAANTLVGSAKNAYGAAAAQGARLFTSPGSSIDQVLAGYSQRAWNQAVSPFQKAFQFQAPRVPTQLKATDITNGSPPPVTGTSVDQVDQTLRSGADTNYDQFSRTNPPESGYIDPNAVIGSDVYNFVDPQGHEFSVTQAQYNMDPAGWDQRALEGGWQLLDTAATPTDIPQDPNALPTDAPQQSGVDYLSQLYTQMQEAAGIPKLIAEIRDLQNQQLAARNAIDTMQQEVMNDPDFSLASKDRRIAYITGQSAAGVAYRDTTARLQALGGLLEQSNNEIQQRLGLYAPAIQAAFAPRQQESQDNYSLQFDNGTAYVFNKKTGQFQKSGGSTGGGKAEQDIIAALNKDQDWQNWQVVEQHFSSMKGIVSAFGDPNDQNTWNKLANSAADVRNFAVALARIQDPASSRLADAGDATRGQSIAAQASDYFNMLMNDRNATPRNLEEFWNNALRNLKSTYRPRGQAAEQRIRNAYGASSGSNPLGLTPPSNSSNDFPWESI